MIAIMVAMSALTMGAALGVVPASTEARPLDVERQSWPRWRDSVQAAMKAWVAKGGAYIGTCMGAFLAGETRARSTSSRATSPTSTIRRIQWRTSPRPSTFRPGRLMWIARLSASKKAEVDAIKNPAFVDHFAAGKLGTDSPAFAALPVTVECSSARARKGGACRLQIGGNSLFDPAQSSARGAESVKAAWGLK